MFDNNDDQKQDNQPQAAEQRTGATSKVVAPPEPASNGTLEADQPAGQADTQPGSGGLPGNLTAPAATTDESAAPAPATTAPPPSSGGAGDAPVASDDLLALKQDALQQLSPLVSHLDQTPEERFRTTMMMIQATDDSTKIKDAYDAAQQIKDDKARAQALLDIVNEINYFTQQHNQPEKQ